MTVIESIRGEFLRYKALAEAAMRQVSDADLETAGGAGTNSIAVICRHVSGNLRSRFTDFLTTDGEKPWRQRDDEFEPRAVSRADLLSAWEAGWRAVLTTLDGLTDRQLAETVSVRGEPFLVHEALHRAMAHVAYHVGQIVYAAKALRGEEWRCLSIPRGQSAAYNARPGRQHAAAHAEALAALDSLPDARAKPGA